MIWTFNELVAEVNKGLEKEWYEQITTRAEGQISVLIWEVNLLVQGLFQSGMKNSEAQIWFNSLNELLDKDDLTPAEQLERLMDIKRHLEASN